jgi:hypothetical protein
MRHLPTWLLAAGALSLGYAVHLGGGAPYPISFILLAIAALATAFGITGSMTRSAPTTVERLLLFGLSAQFALLFVFPIQQYLVGVTDVGRYAYVGALVLGLLGSLLLMRSTRLSWPLFGTVVGIHFLLGLWMIGHSPEPFIDVWHFQQEAVDALLRGTNPYLPIYEDIYGGESQFYGPGIIENGQLTVGLPYPPLSLLMALPGKLLGGDHRYAQLIALELAAVAIALIRPGRLGAGAALCFLFMPRTLLIMERGWTEPFGVLLLALVVLAAIRAPRFLGIAVGLLIAVKQYLLLGLPLALLLARRVRASGWRLFLTAIITASIVTLPFVLWDPDAFFNSTVRFLAAQPFRADSLTFLALLPFDAADISSVVAFGLLVPAMAWIAWRAPHTPTGYAGGLAFLLLVFVAFGKQGAINYYFMVMGALYIAVAARAAEEPASADSRPVPGSS